MAISKRKLLEMYRNLLTARRLDEKLTEIYESGEIGSTSNHRGTGQEAVAIGILANLRKDDYILFRTREHPLLFAKEGHNLKDIIASQFLRDVPKSGGHGSYDYIDADYGILGRSHCLGEDIPIYAGGALSAVIRGTDQVSVIISGDGGASRGPVHETMVIAGAWNLPIIFVLENNQYAMGTSSRREVYRFLKDLSDRGRGYGFPSYSVDGNDLLDVYETTKKCVDRARKGSGPSFMAIETYRLRAHNVGDAELYRPKGEAEEWWKKDPLPRYEKKLMSIGVLTKKDIAKYEAEVKAELDKAAKEGLKLPLVSYNDYIKDAVVDVLLARS